MIDRFSSKEELANKVEWEGGLVEAIIGYGITSDELPIGTPEDVIEAWQEIESIGGVVDFIYDWLEDDIEIKEEEKMLEDVA